MMTMEVCGDPTIRYGGDGGASPPCRLRKRSNLVAVDHRYGHTKYDGNTGAADDGGGPYAREHGPAFDAAPADDYHDDR